MVLIPMYWIPVDVHPKGFVKNYVKYIPDDALRFIENSGMKVLVTLGIPARSFGIWNPTIVFSPSKKYPKEVFTHELGHLYFKHPLINALYFTWCCLIFSFFIFLNPLLSLILFPVIIVLTNYKTLIMEIFADRIADNFENIEPFLKSLPESWFKRKRLAALDGTRTA